MDLNTVCDVCGQVTKQSKVHKVRDRFSTQFGLVVCRKCLDKVNAQARVSSAHETPLANPELVRSYPTITYPLNENSDRVPSAPERVEAYALGITSPYVYLKWLGCEGNGSDRIIGYKITRAEPQLAYQFTIEADTGTPEPYYIDLTADVDVEYTYTVSAINAYGLGAESEICYYPTNRANSDILSGLAAYLLESTTGYALRTGDGEYIIVYNN